MAPKGKEALRGVGEPGTKDEALRVIHVTGLLFTRLAFTQFGRDRVHGFQACDQQVNIEKAGNKGLVLNQGR